MICGVVKVDFSLLSVCLKLLSQARHVWKVEGLMRVFVRTKMAAIAGIPCVSLWCLTCHKEVHVGMNSVNQRVTNTDNNLLLK